MSAALDAIRRRDAEHIQIIEKLSLHEQFRLVEIAHETRDSEIRTAALAVLQQYLHPLIKPAPSADRLK